MVETLLKQSKQQALELSILNRVTKEFKAETK